MLKYNNVEQFVGDSLEFSCMNFVLEYNNVEQFVANVHKHLQHLTISGMPVHLYNHCIHISFVCMYTRCCISWWLYAADLIWLSRLVWNDQRSLSTIS